MKAMAQVGRRGRGNGGKEKGEESRKSSTRGNGHEPRGRGPTPWGAIIKIKIGECGSKMEGRGTRVEKGEAKSTMGIVDSLDVGSFTRWKNWCSGASKDRNWLVGM